MPLSYAAFFDLDRGYYRARRWGKVAGKWIDGAVRIPDEWWEKRGFKPPSGPSSKFDSIALRYAAKEAEDHETALVKRLGVSGTKRTLKQVFALMKDLNPSRVSDSTILKWEVDFENLSSHIDVDQLVPDDVTLAVMTRYRNARLSDEKVPRAQTILNEMSFLRQLIRFALDFADETGATVIRVNKLPVVESDASRKVALSIDEFRAIYGAAAERDRDILWTGVSTLLRKSNLLGLDASWLDFSRAWLHIDRTLLKGGRRKNRRDLDVPIAEATKATLDRYGKRTGLLWPNERTGLALTWYEHVLEDLATRTGVRPFSLHDLRDTGISWLSAAKVSDLVIKRLAGHAETGDVTHSYIQIFEPELREAVAVFDDIRIKVESASK